MSFMLEMLISRWGLEGSEVFGLLHYCPERNVVNRYPYVIVVEVANVKSRVIDMHYRLRPCGLKQAYNSMTEWTNEVNHNCSRCVLEKTYVDRMKSYRIKYFILPAPGTYWRKTYVKNIEVK
jgi:hypothetical protein